MTSYAENRKARHDYTLLETFEAGLVLTGQETKSVRTGGAKLQGAFLKIYNGELWLINASIASYTKAVPDASYDPGRSRKALLRKKELRTLARKTDEKGLTLVPLSLYPHGRRVKLSFALARGKQAHDKREAIKQREQIRSVRRFLHGKVGDE